jgi:hypothetical protein
MFGLDAVFCVASPPRWLINARVVLRVMGCKRGVDVGSGGVFQTVREKFPRSSPQVGQVTATVSQLTPSSARSNGIPQNGCGQEGCFFPQKPVWV